MKDAGLSANDLMDPVNRTSIFAQLNDIDPKARLVVGQSIFDNYFFEVQDHKITPKLIGHRDSPTRNVLPQLRILTRRPSSCRRMPRTVT